MTTHLKPGFCYELQLRLGRAMDVTKLLKLENSRNHESYRNSDIFQRIAKRFRTFDNTKCAQV
jgi:hypothetical protein